MKLFKQLLVAPAALGLLSPLSASAQQLASLNGMSAVNEYMNQQDIDRFRAWEAKNQVTSVTQFSDVRPTDWAYQALSNLVDKYGCVAGYPNGTFKGGNPMSRYEAAALLNSCLDRVTEQTDELKRLMDEFQQELTVLRGRVDGLEKKVGQLEAMQFSTTTKLQGETTFVLGGVGYGGNMVNDRHSFRNLNDQTGARRAAPGLAVRDAVSFNYDMRLNFLTSWTGKDLLYTRLRAGNFQNSAFNGVPVPAAKLDKASQPAGSPAEPNTVFLDRLYYRFPLNKEFSATIGARVRNTEILAFRPQAYNADILDFFTLSGAPGAYNKATGPGFGLSWKQSVKKGQPYLTASASYVAETGADGNPNPQTAADTGGGLFNAYSRSSFNVQLGGRGTNWGVAANYRYGTCGTNDRAGTPYNQNSISCNNIAGYAGNNSSSNAIGLGAYWEPKSSGTIIPSLSIGWGYNSYSQSLAAPTVTSVVKGKTVANPLTNSDRNVAASQSWAVALQWKDAFVKGNAAGFAFGQPTFVSQTRNGMGFNDGNYALEGWYRFQVTDNISVTPAVFYLSNPLGQTAAGAGNYNGTGQGYLSNLGALIQTQFKF